MSASTDITPMLGALFTVIRSKDPHARPRTCSAAACAATSGVGTTISASAKYCAGGELTIADLSLIRGYARAKGAVPETCEGLPNLERWATEAAGGGHSAGHQSLSARQGLS